MKAYVINGSGDVSEENLFRPSNGGLAENRGSNDYVKRSSTVSCLKQASVTTGAIRIIAFGRRTGVACRLVRGRENRVQLLSLDGLDPIGRFCQPPLVMLQLFYPPAFSYRARIQTHCLLDG